jgi:beta-mannosidase
MEWSLASSADPDAPPREGAWSAIAGPMTAAAALQHRDGRDFDDETWWWRARFDAPVNAQVLGLDGIATCAQAWLNGERIVSSANMFVRHRVDATKLLRSAGNELLIRCAPLNAELKVKRPRPRWRAPMVAHQQLRWWRTTLLGRTPGWSPPLAPVGPWRNVWIGPREAVVRESLWLHAHVEGGEGVVRCKLDSPAELQLARDGREWNSRDGMLRIPHVALWWPHTHGEPAVYEAKLRIGHHEIALPPVGFRTIEADTSDGGFGLRVNNEPVFCRGAVWMPLDAASLRAEAGRYTDALAQVCDAGMNMLRVAGTTVYEEDAFYEACDRAGVLVWQDFMFANMDYPSHDEAFAGSVQIEVRQQLQRLHAHPCVAVLCGNSEAEQQAAMWGAPREAWEHPLFHDTLPRLCEELAPRIPYWPSSAHGGALPQQPDTGTTSYYGVGAYLRPIEDARLSGLKFATECLAFANLPRDSSAPDLRVPRDLGAMWDFADVRDHYLERLHAVNARELRRSDPERYLDLSSRVTGEVMARCFSDWRRPGSRCRGALVLMLRDLWPGAGWGLIDDEGTPKPCWDALKPVLQPLALLLTDEGMNGLYAHAVNDKAHARQLRLQLRATLGDAVVADATRSIDVPARGAVTVACASLLDHFLDLNWSHRFGPRPCDLVTCTLLDETGAVVAEVCAP